MKLRQIAMTLAAASAVALAGPSLAQSDNTNSRTAPARTEGFNNWMSDYSTAHQGRISRQAYMDEMVEAHQSALNLMQRYAQDGDVAAIKAFAAATAPAVQEHLTRAKALHDPLK